jgi:hypothetical protein
LDGLGAGDWRIGRFDLAVGLGLGWPDADPGWRASLSLKVAAPPDWWRDIAGADYALAGQSQVGGRLAVSVGCGPVSASSRWRLELALGFAEGCTARKLATAWAGGRLADWQPLLVGRLSLALSGQE